MQTSSLKVNCKPAPWHWICSGSQHLLWHGQLRLSRTWLQNQRNPVLREDSCWEASCFGIALRGFLWERIPVLGQCWAYWCIPFLGVLLCFGEAFGGLLNAFIIYSICEGMYSHLEVSTSYLEECSRKTTTIIKSCTLHTSQALCYPPFCMGVHLSFWSQSSTAGDIVHVLLEHGLMT